MANQDSFINEVTEEVRRDRLFALIRRYGWIAVLLVVVVVAGAAWNEWRKATARASAEARGNAVIAALEAETAEARAEALQALDTAETPSGRAIVGLLTAAAEYEAELSEDAAATLDAIAADESFPQVYRDLAVLKLIMTSADMTADDRIAQLAPLAVAGNPFRLLAVEQRAFAEVEKGDTDAAMNSLQSILEDAETSEDLRRRARQLIVALGGSLEQG